MKETAISACYISPSPSAEHFIADHVFMYLVSGSMIGYDGTREYRIRPGDYGIGRRNHLAKYTKVPVDGAFKKIFILFSQDFLKAFREQYSFVPKHRKHTQAIVPLAKDERVSSFVQSLTPYFNAQGMIEAPFLDIKRTELLLLLLQADPELADLFFDFTDPGKLDLEAFMLKHFRFNVSIERFAYLTGRSLSAFKRDFEKTFGATPGHWLVKKRLEEAHHLIDKRGKRPSDIYLDLGFEDLSHFSFAFKKLFGYAPSQLNGPKRTGK